MDFKKQKPIFQQIADTLCERIVGGEWKAEERIPSVRDIAVQLGVNPNTIVRTFDYMQQAEIIYNKRGLGYFVTKGAKKQILKARKKEFMKERLPELFRQMQLLDISIDDVAEAYKKLTEC